MARNKGKSNGAPIKSKDGFVTIGGNVGQEMGIGEVVEGAYGGISRTMPGRKRGTIVPFYLIGDRPLLGSTVLKSRIEEGIKSGLIKEGREMRITRLPDAKKKPGMAPAKIYKVEVKA